MTKKTMVMAGAVALAIAFMTSLIVFAEWQQKQEDTARARKVELVQTICTIAHNEVNGDSEHACALAQDMTGAEFLCSHTKNVCWTELKQF